MNLKRLNQSAATVVTIHPYEYLFSYTTLVAYADHKLGMIFATNKHWSKTTSKHINSWRKTLPSSFEFHLLEQIDLDHIQASFAEH